MTAVLTEGAAVRGGTQWPWVTAVVAVALGLNPLGIDVLTATFVSVDPLSRAIWRPIVLMGAVLLAAIAFIEWLTRIFIRKRRAGGATHS